MNLTATSESKSLLDASLSPAISVRSVAFAYGERSALDGLSLAVPPGAIFGLLGPNGSGKSTLLSLLIGTRVPAAGDIRLLGEEPGADVRARLGVLFQDGSLDPLMTVGETMRLHARLFGMPRDLATARTAELLERMRLDDRATSPTATLSGGMRRRLELARALLPAPDLLLLDEPTLALDPDSRLALWDYLREANAAGCTLLVATNDVHEAERYCHRVALLDHGKLVAQGAPSDLKRELRRESVRIEWRDDVRTGAPNLESWDGVGHVRWAGREAHATVDDASAFLTRLFRDCGPSVQGVRTTETTLEDVYFQLVGHGIASAGDTP